MPLSLSETYSAISPSVVAIVSTISCSSDGSIPEFADILGTGFLVDATGIIATNRHIVEVLKSLPINPVTGKRAGAVMAFGKPAPFQDGFRLPNALLDIDSLTSFHEKINVPGWYGSQVLDIGFLQVKAKETPFIRISDTAGLVQPGLEVAIAGFPNGTWGIVLNHEEENRPRLRQIGPTVRKGIVASVFPAPVPRPHGFTIDIMTQGGASGSPVFLPDEPLVVGMVASGPEYINSTVCEWSGFIVGGLKKYKDLERLAEDADNEGAPR